MKEVYRLYGDIKYQSKAALHRNLPISIGQTLKNEK